MIRGIWLGWWEEGTGGPIWPWIESLMGDGREEPHPHPSPIILTLTPHTLTVNLLLSLVQWSSFTWGRRWLFLSLICERGIVVSPWGVKDLCLGARGGDS